MSILQVFQSQFFLTPNEAQVPYTYATAGDNELRRAGDTHRALTPLILGSTQPKESQIKTSQALGSL